MRTSNTIYTKYNTAVLAACLLATAPIAIGANAQSVNYVRTYDAMAPITHPDSLLHRPARDVRLTTQYLDGLGRPVQTVVRQGSQVAGQAAVDMVSTNVYDAYGRETVKYLPFAANAAGGNTSISNGGYKTNALQQQVAFGAVQYPGESHYYSKTNFEPSPLGRPLEQYAPGSSWAGSEANANPALRRSMQTRYAANTAADSVVLWTVTPAATFWQVGNCQPSATNGGRYAPGQLYKTISTDEHKKQVIEYKNKDGRVVLKKVQLTAAPDTGGASTSAHAGWLCTYYIYDYLGNLRFVLQPAAVDKLISAQLVPDAAMLDELAFCYTYDRRGRMTLKKVPGAAAVYMVYDQRDRPVLTQDGHLRTQGKWQYTQYDALNRPIATGLWTNGQGPELHAALAPTGGGGAGSNYPSLAGQTYEELTNTFYDNYSWLAQYNNPLPAAYSTVHHSHLLPHSDAQWPYPQTPMQRNAATGMVTGSRTKVIGSANTYLYTVSFYDDKGRVIQTHSTNSTGGTDILTTQYAWAGQPLVSVQQHQRTNTSGVQRVITKMEYDDLWRLATVKKAVQGHVNGQAVNSAEKVVLKQEYDALGQVSKKVLGNGGLGNTALETLNYDYNIRGWLLGANRDYVKDLTPAYFGFELAYDKTGNIIPGQAYDAAQYNGNISGTTWKAAGDGEKRRYDFTYDAVNRLTGADFNQLTSGSFSKSAGLDFSVSNLTFDANGNILSMAQRGWKVGGSVAVDKLQYGYQLNSNKLISVTDTANDNSSKLGDFKYDPATKTATDYTYDVNGNMVADQNKRITNIQYNHLNLPQTVTVAPGPNSPGGSIEYVYDAAGNKLKKIVHETGKPDKTTEYISGFVYEDSVLQFTGHEEGRIRLVKQYWLNGDSTYRWQYDYFLKDQLGNVRTVLTEQTDTAKYMATFETAARPKETALFDNITETAYPIVSILNPAYPADGTTNPNAYTSRLVGNGKKTGATMGLKVMTGDRFDVAVKAWVPNAVTTEGSSPLTPENLLGSLINIMSAKTALLSGKATAAELSAPGSPLHSGIQAFVNNRGDEQSDAEAPRAYLNWMLFDEQFNYVPQGSGFLRVKFYSDRRLQTLAQMDIPVAKSGYLFVFLTNETNDKVTFFDNLVVQHYTGPLTEENAYYPFGLMMAGISSKAAGKLQNKEKTFQGQRFDDELGLNWIQFKWRNHDPQIGRFIEIDPLADEYEYNSTYAFSENKVIGHVELEGLESNDIKDMVENDKVIDGQMSLEEKQVRTKSRATSGMVGIAIVASVLIPGPDEILLMSALNRVSAAIRTIKTVDKVKDAVEDVRKVEQVVDKAADLKKAQEKAAKLSQKQRPGLPFTKAGKEAVKDVNKAKNNGKTVCENCGTNTKPARQSKKGEVPSKAETQVDHIIRRKDGGSGTPDNGQVLCRGCNLEKH